MGRAQIVPDDPRQFQVVDLQWRRDREIERENRSKQGTRLAASPLGNTSEEAVIPPAARG